MTAADRIDRIWAGALFAGALLLHVWGVTSGWNQPTLPGNEFRQTQTAITALFIQRGHDYSLSYPTPVLGKPWSVPFEFPLYQWCVVLVSDAGGWPLVASARAVSWACLLLTLPALWLLLGRWRLGRGARLAMLSLVLVSPLYIFYARAFLIETMALMFSLWFALSFMEAVDRRSWPWLLLALLSGAGAGLVKVTTFLVYLFPVGLWAAWRLLALFRGGERGIAAWCRALLWPGVAAGIPSAITLWWIRYADAVKRAGPSGRPFVSERLHDYNFGTWETRFSGEIWQAHWQNHVANVAPAAVLLMALVIGLLHAGRYRAWAIAAGGLYLVVQAVFPILYAWHEYYFVAIGVVFLVGVGFILTDLLASDRPRTTVWAVITCFVVTLAVSYIENLRPQQVVDGLPGNGITDLIQDLTEPDDVLIIAGQDWSSVTPYYSQRRALMIRRKLDRDWGFLNEAFAALRGEPVGALLLSGDSRENPELVALAQRYFGIETKPLVANSDTVVYVHPRLHDRILEHMRRVPYRGVVLVEGAGTETRVAGRQRVELAILSPRQRMMFDLMSPRPVNFTLPFGLDVTEMGGQRFINAHPDASFVFAVAPGRHRVSAQFALLPAAYEGLGPDAGTDGVMFTFKAVAPGGRSRLLAQRFLNPLSVATDRGVQKLEAEIDLQADEELWFGTGPGPAGSYQRDWAVVGPITVR